MCVPFGFPLNPLNKGYPQNDTSIFCPPENIPWPMPVDSAGPIERVLGFALHGLAKRLGTSVPHLALHGSKETTVSWETDINFAKASFCRPSVAYSLSNESNCLKVSRGKNKICSKLQGPKEPGKTSCGSGLAVGVGGHRGKTIRNTFPAVEQAGTGDSA